jgi:hypothetical protein
MPKSAAVANPDDHAIVVGIAHYPGFLNEDGKPSDLAGPVTSLARCTLPPARIQSLLGLKAKPKAARRAKRARR